MSFDTCLLSLRLSQKLPVAKLRELAEKYTRAGVAPEEAMKRVIRDQIELAKMEERSIVAAVRQAWEAKGGSARPARTAPAQLDPAPTAKPEKAARQDVAPMADLNDMFLELLAEEAQAKPASDDLNAMFAELLAEESGVDPRPTVADTVKPKKPRAKKTPYQMVEEVNENWRKLYAKHSEWFTGDGPYKLKADAPADVKAAYQAHLAAKKAAKAAMDSPSVPAADSGALARAIEIAGRRPSDPTTAEEIELMNGERDIQTAQAINQLLRGESMDKAGLSFVEDGRFTKIMRNGLSIGSIQGRRTRDTVLRSLQGNMGRSASEATASAAKNTAAGFAAAITGLGELFGGNIDGKMGVVDLDETKYQRALPLFNAAIENFGQAAADIREVMRAVIRAVKEQFGYDVTANMQPYIVRFVEDYRNGKTKGENNAADSANGSAARDQEYGADGEPGTSQSLFDVGAAPGGTARRAGGGAGRAGAGPLDGAGVSGRDAALGGETGDQRLPAPAPGPDGRAAEPRNTSRSGASGGRRAAPVAKPEGAPAGAADGSAEQDPKLAAQTRANAVAVKLGDRANIDATLPYLLEGQRDDVAFAEARFAATEQGKMPGVLFTNGTGTGKTFTGLGIIARQIRAGKTEGMIVVPNNQIAQDWINSGARLGITIRLLDSTSENGTRGASITTYANFGANPTLADRDYDWLLADESHYLMASKDGDHTDALGAFRALTRHPSGFAAYSRMKNRDLFELLAETTNKESARAKHLFAQIREREEAQKEAYAAIANAPAKRPRAIFLSATPFAYVKSVDYAEGYLFEYPADGKIGNSNQDGRAHFFVQHFGYRIRYHKLTEPDGNVDVGLMARQFNSWLKSEGALSGRMLEVEADYGRRFIQVESALGAKIDEGMEFMREHAEYKHLYQPFMKEFTYLRRRYLLEAIKAKEALPIIQQHLDMGRKVVVIHDYKKGGASNPFHMTGINGTTTVYDDAMKPTTIDLAELAEKFKAERPDLVRLQFPATSALQTLTGAHPNALVHNGDIPAKQLEANKRLFNDDDSGRNVIILQSDKGREGISLHDTTGRHQRVEVVVGMAAKPTALIQLEGRTYRTGQVTDAAFDYIVTGTMWERWTFAQTIAERADIAEALAMGEQARALKDAIVEAFEGAGPHAITDQDGKGGKARDRQAAKLLTDWDRARSFYYGQMKRTSSTKALEGKDYFATPEPLGLKMVEWADIRPGEDVLEPSAGHGAIARWFPILSNKTINEPSTELVTRARLAVDGQARFLQGKFEDINIVNKYDAIVMNPPFGLGGSLAIPHVKKAYQHLREGGRIVALLPKGPAADGKLEKFLYGEDAPKDLYMVADINLPASTFERAGTGVMTHIVILDKISDPAKAPHQVSRDYVSAEDVEEFFERIQHASVPGRVKTEAPLDIALEEVKKAPKKQPRAAAPDATGAERYYAQFEFDHTKTGEKMYGAAMLNRVSMDAYKEANAIAKKHGGWYNKFVGGGALRGFLFKSGEDRAAFMAEAGQLAEVSAGIDEQNSALPGGLERRTLTIEVDGVRRPITDAKGRKVGQGFREQMNFWNWFGDSKVTDEQGRPLVVYHGTNKDFDTFKPSWRGSTHWFAEQPDMANGFVAGWRGNFGKRPGKGSNVMPVYLSISKPLDLRGKVPTESRYQTWPDLLDRLGLPETPAIKAALEKSGVDMARKDMMHAMIETDAFLDAIKASGYDGMRWDDSFSYKGGEKVGGKLQTIAGYSESWAVFRPEQIKSATGNAGTFNPDDPDILASRMPTFYSALARTIPDMEKIAAKDRTLKAEQARLWLMARQKEGKFKAEELQWSGLDDWLKAQGGRVSVEDIALFVEQNGVQVEEVVKGKPDEADIEALLDDEAGEGMSREDAIEYLSQEEGAPKYSQYVLPGGENYRELLLTLPEKAPTSEKLRQIDAQLAAMGPLDTREQFKAWDALQDERLAEVANLAAKQRKAYKSSHWDETNIIAHVRFNDRTDAEGRRVLFIEELQSDWGQQGKKQGFATSKSERVATKATRADGYWEVVDQDGRFVTNIMDYTMPDATEADALRIAQARLEHENSVSVARDNRPPAAPFVTDTKAWLALGIKRMMRYAAENGYDRVAFVNGQQSADRYDLSKQISRVEYDDNQSGGIGRPSMDGEPGAGTLNAYDLNGKQVISQYLDNPAKAEDYIGKEAAAKLFKQEPSVARSGGIGVRRRELSGIDLKVGGEGMKSFYDKIVPQTINEVLKKVGGGKATSINIAVPDGSYAERARYVGPAHSIDQLRAALAVANKGGSDIMDNPLTGDRMTYAFNRTIVAQGIRKMISLMESGEPFAQAVMNDDIASPDFAQMMGGRYENTPSRVAYEQASIEGAAASYIEGDIDAADFIEQTGLPLTESEVDARLGVRLESGSRVERFARTFAEEMMRRFAVAPPIQQVGFDITPELREKALDGLPLFSKAVDQGRRQLLAIAAAAAMGEAKAGGVKLGKSKAINPQVLARRVDPAIERILRRDTMGDTQLASGQTNINGARALKDAMRAISLTGPKELRALAAQVAKLLPTDGVMLTVDDTSRMNVHGVVHLSPMVHMRLFTAEGRHGLNYDTLIHEALHVAVAARYRSLSMGMARDNDALMGLSAPAAADAMAQFEAVWEEFRTATAREQFANRDIELAVTEARGNPDEFFVRALTDPLLQAYMAGKRYEGKTLWARFKDWIKSSLFGFREAGTAPSWLDAALMASESLAQSMGGDRADFARMGAVSRYQASRSSESSRAIAPDAVIEANMVSGAAVTQPTEAQVEEYSYGNCMWFALAAHDITGWPIEAILDKDGSVAHAWVRMPDGRSFDIAGPKGADDFIQFDKDGVKPYSRSEFVKLLDGENHAEVSKADNVIRTIYSDSMARKMAPVPTWTAPADTKVDRLRHTLQDKHVDMKRTVQAVREAIGDLGDKWDPYLQEELFHGRSATGFKSFLEDELRPLLVDMQARGVTMEELEEYLHMRHAEEANARLASINEGEPDGLAGVPTDEALDYLANLPPKKAAAYAALAARVDAIIKGTQQQLVDYGLESQDTIDAWNATYQHYVPLMREDMENAQLGNGTGSGYSVRGPASRARTGSKRQVVNIMANIAMARERAIVRGEKNRISMALYGLALQSPNPGFWRPVNPLKNRAALEAELDDIGLSPAEIAGVMEEPRKKRINKQTGMVESHVRLADRNLPTVVAVRINGQDRFLFFSPHNERAVRMAAAIKNVREDQLDGFMGVVGAFTRFLAAVNTQYNPIFGAVNLVRDVGEGSINLSNTPIAGKQADVLAEAGMLLAKVIKGRGRMSNLSGADAALWAEFQAEGGITGYRAMFSRSEDRAKELATELRRLSTNPAAKAGQAIFDWLSDYNEALENITRLAAYKVAKAEGLTNQRAASLAKNLTVNFNRKGAKTRYLGALYAFFNAAVQGTSRMADTLAGPAGAKIVAGGIMVGVLQAVMLALAGFDDEDIPEFVRAKNLVIPASPFDGDKDYYTVPLPLGFSFLPSIGRIGTEFSLGGMKQPGRYGTRLLAVLLDTFNPLDSSTPLQMVSPTLMDPLAALSENRDWTGRAIALKDYSTLKPTPGHTRAKETATVVGKGLSEFFNAATGGTEYTPGAFSPTPDQIDYLIGQFTGGVGRELMKAQQTGAALVTGEEISWNKVPLAGRFYSDANDKSAVSTKFYENVQQLAVHAAEIKGRREDRLDTSEYRAEHPEAALATKAEAVLREVGQLRQQRRRWLEKGDKVRVKEYELKIRSRMQGFNAEVEAARKAAEA